VGALNDMIVFDTLVCNTDRHYEDFGELLTAGRIRLLHRRCYP